MQKVDPGSPLYRLSWPSCGLTDVGDGRHLRALRHPVEGGGDIDPLPQLVGMGLQPLDVVPLVFLKVSGSCQGMEARSKERGPVVV